MSAVACTSAVLLSENGVEAICVGGAQVIGVALEQNAAFLHEQGVVNEMFNV